MNIKKLLLATLAIWLFGIIWTMLTCGWLFNWVYTIPPIIWKQPTEMMMMGNMIGSNIMGLTGTFLFVLVYALLYKTLPKKGVNKGIFYGFLVYLVGPFSGFIGMPFYMTIANTYVIYALINMLVKYLIMGAIVGAIYKTK